MGKFALLMLGCVLVVGLLVYAGGDLLRQYNAPALADAQARIAEAQARIVEAEARASIENTEEAYQFASLLATGLLVLVAVVFGLFAAGFLLLLCSGPAQALQEWRNR